MVVKRIRNNKKLWEHVKKLMADNIKEQRKTLYLAKLNNCPTSPRKMRLIADMIRGVEVEKASVMLQFSKKDAAKSMEKTSLVGHQQL